jgi:hypothetical protein
MSTELTVQTTATAVETVVANAPNELQALQAPLVFWARKALENAWAEYHEYHDAAVKAKKQRWNSSALTKAANGAVARITFYQKSVKALEAGYMLFPPVPNADVIAVRLAESKPPCDVKTERWGTPYMQVSPKVPLVAGEGEYFHPVVHWTLLRKLKDDKGNNVGAEWQALNLENPVFPLAMGKPSIVEAVNAAMEQKVFDEIRMFPFTRRQTGDPCILGSIIEHKTDRRFYFLISWRVDMADF